MVDALELLNQAGDSGSTVMLVISGVALAIYTAVQTVTLLIALRDIRSGDEESEDTKRELEIVKLRLEIEALRNQTSPPKSKAEVLGMPLEAGMPSEAGISLDAAQRQVVEPAEDLDLIDATLAVEGASESDLEMPPVSSDGPGYSEATSPAAAPEPTPSAPAPTARRKAKSRYQSASASPTATKAQAWRWLSGADARSPFTTRGILMSIIVISILVAVPAFMFAVLFFVVGATLDEPERMYVGFLIGLAFGGVGIVCMGMAIGIIRQYFLLTQKRPVNSALSRPAA